MSKSSRNMYTFSLILYVFRLLIKNYYIYYDRQCLIASMIALKPIPMTTSTCGLTATYMRIKPNTAKNIHVRMSVLIIFNVQAESVKYLV